MNVLLLIHVKNICHIQIQNNHKKHNVINKQYLINNVIGYQINVSHHYVDNSDLVQKIVMEQKLIPKYVFY